MQTTTPQSPQIESFLRASVAWIRLKAESNTLRATSSELNEMRTALRSAITEHDNRIEALKVHPGRAASLAARMQIDTDITLADVWLAETHAHLAVIDELAAAIEPKVAPAIRRANSAESLLDQLRGEVESTEHANCAARIAKEKA